MHAYTAKLTYKAKTGGHFRAMRGKLFERDVEIGTFRRAPVQDGFVPPIEYKFHSQAAGSRFDDFADSLSIEETIDALVAHLL